MSLKERVIADLKAMAHATVIQASVGDSIIYMGDNKSNWSTLSEMYWNDHVIILNQC